jgi:hypothetical protein
MSENDKDQADEPTKSVEKNEFNTDQVDGLTASEEKNESNANQADASTESADENDGITVHAEEATDGADASEETLSDQDGVNDETDNSETLDGSAEDVDKGLGLEEKVAENSYDEGALNSETSTDSDVEADADGSIGSDGASGGKTNTDDQINLPKENVTSVDIVAASQGVATVELELINSNLKGIEKEISQLAHPTDQHLDKAKRLILMLSGVTGIVLVASITFFVVMSVSIAQKVDDLDRVLMAVAKRGIQLADGIEIIAEMEGKLSEVIDQNGKIIPGLSGIEIQVSSVGKNLTNSEEQTRSAMREQSASILKSQSRMGDRLNVEVSGLEELIKKSVKLKPLAQDHSALKSQLERINNSVTNVEAKVQDLYVIKQAEIETAYKGLSGSE